MISHGSFWTVILFPDHALESPEVSSKNTDAGPTSQIGVSGGGDWALVFFLFFLRFRR